MAAGLIAAFIYMFLVLIEAERGNPFRGWIMYVFCAAAFALAAAGTIADNIRLNRRPKTPTETHPNTPTAHTHPKTPTGTPPAHTHQHSDQTPTADPHPTQQPAAHTQTPTGAPPAPTLSGTDPNPAR